MLRCHFDEPHSGCKCYSQLLTCPSLAQVARHPIGRRKLTPDPWPENCIGGYITPEPYNSPFYTGSGTLYQQQQMLFLRAGATGYSCLQTCIRDSDCFDANNPTFITYCDTLTLGPSATIYPACVSCPSSPVYCAQYSPGCAARRCRCQSCVSKTDTHSLRPCHKQLQVACLMLYCHDAWPSCCLMVPKFICRSCCTLHVHDAAGASNMHCFMPCIQMFLLVSLLCLPGPHLQAPRLTAPHLPAHRHQAGANSAARGPDTDSP